MKAIVLLGGFGTRLDPTTRAISKQLIPVYDKPMCYYSMSIPLMAGIRDILIISTPEHTDLYKKLFGDGSHLGVNFTYKVQERPVGLPDAFIIGEEFIGDDMVMLVLGDNILWGDGLTQSLSRVAKKKSGATIFVNHVNDPSRFGVVEFDKNKNIISIEEKPTNPKSNYAIVGVYVFDSNAAKIAKSLRPSKRGEIEMVDMINQYMSVKNLTCELLGRGIYWGDTGTYDSLLQASNFVQTIQNNQGLTIACLEEISFNNKWISKSDLKKLIKKNESSNYAKHIKNILSNK